MYVYFIILGEATTVSPSSTVMVPPGISQPSNCVTIVSDTHTTISPSPVTLHSVAEHLTTGCSVATSISGQNVCTITTTSGMRICLHG